MNSDYGNNFDDGSLFNAMQNTDCECDEQSDNSLDSSDSYQSSGDETFSSDSSHDDKLKSTVQGLFVLKTIEEQEKTTLNEPKNSWRGSHPMMYDIIKISIYAVIVMGLVLFVISHIYK